ncbi:MAG: hypothetical protein P4M11_12815 [Candidatus Pacebacteria bacterium]|nr:hypothetical protein [Candidatus Paceibacterota bacterium]
MKQRLVENERKFMPLFMDRSLTRDDKARVILPWWTTLHSEILAEHVSVQKIRV